MAAVNYGRGGAISREIGRLSTLSRARFRAQELSAGSAVDFHQNLKCS